MNYLEIFLTALLSLKSNVLRTALTMLGIIIGIFAVTLVLIISQGATNAITSQVSALGTNLLYIVSTKDIPLTLDDANAILKQVPEVGSVTVEVMSQQTIQANGQNIRTTVDGTTPYYAQMLSLNTQNGSFISAEDVSSYSSVAVIGPKVASDLFGEGANPIGQFLQIGRRSFYVIGVLEPKGGSIAGSSDDTVYVPATTAMNSLTGNNNVTNIDAYVKDEKMIDVAISDVKQLLIDRHNVTDPEIIRKYAIYSSKELLSTVGAITGILSGVLAGIAGISLLVGGIGIMNIMLVTVTERTKEIGLLKAIGAKDNNIMTQFLIEAVVLTVTGGLIGTALAIGAGYFVSSLLKVPFTLPIVPIVGAVVVSIGIGLVFGLYPANRASKMSPIDALRYE